MLLSAPHGIYFSPFLSLYGSIRWDALSSFQICPEAGTNAARISSWLVVRESTEKISVFILSMVVINYAAKVHIRMREEKGHNKSGGLSPPACKNLPLCFELFGLLLDFPLKLLV